MAEQVETEQISGHVERVTFHSADTGFAVLQMKLRGQRDLESVIGKIADVQPGEHVVAEGRWVMDRQHGRQFKAEILKSTPPDSPEGIVKFLGSGLIEGIGPVYAKKLVDKFGRDVLEVIEHRSAKLEEIDGIGPTRRKRIKESWQEARQVREIMTFLMSHGVSTARAFRIYKSYGDKAMTKVQADPYCLARDIRGIGFKTADQIASHFGIDAASPLRARAGIEYMLLQRSQSGHIATPRDELVDITHQELDIPRDILEEALLHGLAKKRLMLETRLAADAPLVYPAHLHRAELELVEDLARLMAQEPPIADADEDKALSWVQEKIGLELAPQQLDALRMALSSKVMIITGGPGVGKTTLVKALIQLFKARNLKVSLAAPTGRAAKRMSESSGSPARTLHRLLIYDPENGGFKHHRENPLKGDIWILDEASMIDLPLASQVLRALPDHAVLILVGDVDQLPSVGPGSVLRDVIDSKRIPVQRLTEIFRQAEGSQIVQNAHRVQRGEAPLSCTPQYPGDFYVIPVEEADAVWDRIRGLYAGKLKQRFGLNPLRDAQILSPMQRGGLGARAFNQQVQALINPRGDQVERFGIIFREGDRVMQLLNNYDKECFNGDMGEIAGIDREEQELWVDFGGRKVTYRFHELDELQLSYAVTIHKSQGSEYPCVILPLHTQHFVMLQRNLLYTGITRGKQLVILVGSMRAIRMAVQNQDSTRRLSCLKARLQERL